MAGSEKKTVYATVVMELRVPEGEAEFGILSDDIANYVPTMRVPEDWEVLSGHMTGYLADEEYLETTS